MNETAKKFAALFPGKVGHKRKYYIAGMVFILKSYEPLDDLPRTSKGFYQYCAYHYNSEHPELKLQHNTPDKQRAELHKAYLKVRETYNCF